MARKSKSPKAQQTPSTKKRPRTSAEPTRYLKLNPSWRISQLEMVEPFGWHKLDPDMADYIKGMLSSFESMTWAEILIDAKKRNHSVPVGDLCKSARQRLRDMRQEDVDEIVSLRLSGKERVWGILEEGVLRLIWWDPEHQVCPSQKKNT